MKKWALVLAVIGLLSSVAMPQSYRGQGRMTGFVYDQDGKPLEGVKVKLYSLKGSSGFEVTTDAKGEWRATYIRGGGWNIDFEKPGYMPKKISVNIPEIMQNPPVETRLQKAAGLIVSEELKAGIKLGNELSAQKKFEEAIAVYLDLIAKNPDAYVLYKNVGNCYFELQKYDQAEEYYRKIFEKEPDNPEIMLLIGNCYSNRGENDKAMQWYSKIEFEKITDPTVLYNIGSALTSQSKFEEAAKYYKRAIQLKSDFQDAIYQLGVTFISLQNNAEAIKTFESYLTLDSDSARADQVKRFIEFLRKK